MLQFTDDRQVRPGMWIGEMPDRTKIRPLMEAKRRAFEACKAEIQSLLDSSKQVHYCEDMWKTRFTPKESEEPSGLWWTGVTVFRCYRPSDGTPEPYGPDQAHEGLQKVGPYLYLMPGRLQKVGIWERVDFGVHTLQ